MQWNKGLLPLFQLRYLMTSIGVLVWKIILLAMLGLKSLAKTLRL